MTVWQMAILALIGFAVLWRINRPERIPTEGTTAVGTFIGKEALDAGITRYAAAGWSVDTVTPMLVNRGAAKLVIGYLAKQRTQYTVLFRRAQHTAKG